MSKQSFETELKRLVKEHTCFYPSGFSISIEEETERWDICLKELGIHHGYDLMADYVCDLYKEKYGEDFLFTNKCVSYEIEYHTDGYMCMMGYKGYIRNITSFLFNKKKLIEHCRVIDISTKDVRNFRQRTMFNYKKGVRPQYRNTPKDPFKR